MGKFWTKGRKASLQLSINAIVILVLAIAMLGLGLGFTKKMFGKFGSQLTIPEPEVFPTSDDPIALPSSSIEVVHGKKFAFSVGFFNNCDTETTVTPALVCSGFTDDDTNKIGFGSFSAGQDVPAGEHRMFKFISKYKAPSAGEIAICTIKFKTEDGEDDGTAIACPGSKQITIKST